MRRARAAALALVALAASGCGGSARLTVEVETESEAPLRLGVPMADDPARLREAYRPLVDHLARGLGRPVELVVSPTYKSVGWLLAQGKADLAWFSGVAHARVSRTHAAVALARAVRRGRTTYVGELVVLADAKVERVEDLKGKRLAYVDPESGSGFFAANQILLDAGLTPGANLAETGFTYGHRKSLEQLAAGRYDAAAVFEGALEVYAPHFPPGKFRVLARSRELANDVVACSPEMDAKQQARVQRLLLDMAKTAAGREALNKLWTYGGLDGFVAP